MKPIKSKREAAIRAAELIGRRPPKEIGDGETRVVWRGDHWRVWLFGGWIDLEDNLNYIGASEEHLGAVRTDID